MRRTGTEARNTREVVAVRFSPRERWRIGKAATLRGLPFSSQRGTKLNPKHYSDAFRAALLDVGITAYIRPFHDARHASLTNGAANGENPIALMTRAGHKSMATTKHYLHLAGTVSALRPIRSKPGCSG